MKLPFVPERSTRFLIPTQPGGQAGSRERGGGRARLGGLRQGSSVRDLGEGGAGVSRPEVSLWHEEKGWETVSSAHRPARCSESHFTQGASAPLTVSP